MRLSHTKGSVKLFFLRWLSRVVVFHKSKTSSSCMEHCLFVMFLLQSVMLKPLVSLGFISRNALITTDRMPRPRCYIFKTIPHIIYEKTIK